MTRPPPRWRGPRPGPARSRNVISQPAPQFETARLRAQPWGVLHEDALAALAREVLSPAVLQALPPSWSGSYDLERARGWVRARDQESIAVLAQDRQSGAAVGFLFLFEDPTQPGPTLRLGYLLRESAWGQGLASELIEGLVRWGHSQPIRSLVGGVEASNLASARVLQKNGFARIARAPGGEHLYERRLGPGS